MRNSNDLHADGPEDDTPVDVELREVHVGVWDAIAKDPPLTATEPNADEALASLGRKLRAHFGRNTMRVVHRDKASRGPAAGR